MFDWNWLWVAGEIGITYGLYRWWKKNDTFLAVLEVTPEIDIDDLKNFSSLTTSVDFATIHGFVQTKDSTVHSSIKSQYVPECVGVIHRLTLREQKLEKIRTVWTETKSVISDFIRHVPFRLVSSKGNYVRIDKPLLFDSITDQLEVTNVKFEPHASSPVQRLVETFVGNVATGIETKEQMLLVNTALTGVGRLEKKSGVWHLVPHEQWKGILTRLSRAEILTSFRQRTKLIRLTTFFFIFVAGCTTIYLISKHYSQQQRQSNRLPDNPPIIEQNIEDNNQNARLHCVICLENEIVYSLQPCSHLGLCHTCAQQLQSQGSGHELCPVCRTPIQQYQRIFLA